MAAEWRRGPNSVFLWLRFTLMEPQPQILMGQMIKSRQFLVARIRPSGAR
jgi:hypothetical protein